MIKTRLFSLLSHAKKYIILNILWQWIALLSQVVIVFTAADVIGKAAAGDVQSVNPWRSAGIIACAVALRVLCDRRITHASYMASADVKRILRTEIYGKILRLGNSYTEKVPTSEIVQVSTEGVDQLETYFGKYIPQLFYSLLAPLTLFVILSRISLRASVVLLVCVPLIPVSIVVVQKIAKRLLNRYWDVYAGLGDSFLENLQGLTTLKIYQADERKAEEMDREADHFRRITMKVLTMQLNSTSVMDIVAYGGTAVGIYTALSQFLAGKITVTGMLCILLLASEFFLPLRLLGSYFHIAMNGMAASDKIFRILDLEEPAQGTSELPAGNADVEWSKVSFGYEPEKLILRDMDLRIPAGSFVSVVGESGSGKSTIADILCGKNKNYRGSITVGDMPLNAVSEKSLMQRVTTVRHNSHLFKGTVRENLLMGNPEASDARMREVLEKVNLLDLIDTRAGLDTPIAEKAANLSGGQQQRLAIARALLKDSSMYIFDEATSNIDMESEEIIMRVIRELAGRKTVLLISHRMANVVHSDKIFMLNNGTIAEQGTHEQLMALRGEYCRLYTAQKELEHYGEVSADASC